MLGGSIRAGIFTAGLVLAMANPSTSDQRAEQPTDAFGMRSPLNGPPQRIVSLSPNLTEILFAIGVDPVRIAGVTRFCDYPEEAKERTEIGGIIDPSVERIIGLRPDLVLATRGNPTEILDQLKGAGLNVFAFESQDGLDRVLQTMEEMIRLVHPDERTMGEDLVREFRTRLTALQIRSRSISDQSRPSVYYYDPVSPDWTSGPGTHISEIIELAGGRNVAADAPTAWPRYALESIVARQPDWLLVAVPRTGQTAEILDGLKEKRGWQALRAVREGWFCLVPADHLLRPGPRTLAAVEALGRCLHPDSVWGGQD